MRHAFSTAIVLMVGLAACSSKTAEGYDCSTWQTTFLRKPLKEQMANFGTYDLESQYKLYICGNQRMEPPAMYLRTPFAREGKAAANFLAGKLATTSYDFTISDILDVLEEMRRLGTYDVAGDAELLAIATGSVARMSNPDEKRRAAKLLADIQGQSR